jgi:probable HAF family extracellular repeat protein
VSADGAVVIGYATIADAYHAFRLSNHSMQDLGTLGGNSSYASGVSADGSVVVGDATTAANVQHAFRWTQAGGMQIVEDWLRANGITISNDITSSANAVNANGTVVVGSSKNNRAFIARVAPALGSGLITLPNAFNSLNH